MNKVHRVIYVVAAIIALTVASNARAEHSFEFGAGAPRGFMDVSANSFLNISLKTSGHWRLQSVLHETFSAKKSDGNWIMANVLAGYLLLRYNFATLESKWVPFVSGGGGIHYILSRDERGLAYGKTLYHYLSAKAHGFAGVELNFKSNKFFAGQVRFTYPSDLLLDAVYINYGIRF